MRRTEARAKDEQALHRRVQTCPVEPAGRQALRVGTGPLIAGLIRSDLRFSSKENKLAAVSPEACKQERLCRSANAKSVKRSNVAQRQRPHSDLKSSSGDSLLAFCAHTMITMHDLVSQSNSEVSLAIIMCVWHHGAPKQAKVGIRRRLLIDLGKQLSLSSTKLIRAQRNSTEAGCTHIKSKARVSVLCNLFLFAARSGVHPFPGRRNFAFGWPLSSFTKVNGTFIDQFFLWNPIYSQQWLTRLSKPQL